MGMESHDMETASFINRFTIILYYVMTIAFSEHVIMNKD
jgi:hypothetical protein